jgi:hypothetical protein
LLLLAAVFVASMATVYLGSVVNPTGHLHDVPVMIIDQDAGAVVHRQHVNVGGTLTSALEHVSSVTSHLKLTSGSLKAAQSEIDRGGTYATLVIPATLTRSALLAAGVQTPGRPPPPTAAVALEQNTRLGTLGVNLATGVMSPAIAQIAPQIGSQLSSLSTPAARANAILADRLATPVSLTTAPYRPLPDHSALGLSAFYVALLALIAGFVAATLVKASVDTALGYSSSQLGPRFSQRRPVAINRRETFLVKWALAGVAAPLVTGIVLLVGVGLLRHRG